MLGADCQSISVDDAWVWVRQERVERALWVARPVM